VEANFWYLLTNHKASGAECYTIVTTGAAGIFAGGGEVKGRITSEAARKFPYKLQFIPSKDIVIICFIGLSVWNNTFLFILNFVINIWVVSTSSKMLLSPEIQRRETDVFGLFYWAVRKISAPYENNCNSK
jgi:hypothetical protein